MKIAVLGTRGFPNVQGGLETHCQNLYPRLVELGCEVSVFARRNYVGEDPAEYRGVKIIPLFSIKNIYLETPLHTFLGVFRAHKYKPDILHFQAIGSALFVPLAKLFGMKVVLTTHGSNYEHKKWGLISRTVLRIAEYLGMKFADEIISISATIAGEVLRKYKRTSTVIPNGIEPAAIPSSDSILKEYNLARGRYILSTGRIIAGKGFSDLITAFGNANLDGWKLVIAGKANYSGKFSRRLHARAASNPNVILPGFLSGRPLQEIYSHAGIFVLPSYYEGMSMALLEALSHGLSCIASDIPANKEFDLEPDRYFAPGDDHTLAQKLELFSTRPIPENERNAQIKKVTEKYDWNVVAKTTLTVLKRAIA